ncbi:unnamed protein product [Cuscuta europaea]|uniref:Retrotransposon Copia-like N-terminal domain-containing protein n=1 Tax=Cuscuta europaea TaxID=41803 RepID=A0A9P1EJX0_CUSEU|nr:unnamed protein product [Cuscuta europaea]
MGDHANSSSHSAGVIPTNNSPTPQLISLNASSQIPIKLSNDGSNYSSWKSQMTNLLFGYDLLGYVDGSTPCPDKSAPNLSFWNRQDRLVLLTLQSTVSGPVGPIINSWQTSAEAWEKLESSFANTSITRMLSLHNTLATTKKAGKSVTEYMGIMEGLVDDLATIGHPVSSGQVMSYVLNGFGQEYKETISALRIQPTPLTLSTLRHHLQQAEILAGDNPDTSISVQYSQRRSNNFSRGRGGRGRGRHTSSNPNPHQHGFGSQASNSRSTVICQLCDKHGHTACTCYNRNTPSVNMTDKSPNAEANAGWLLDTGATHHVTSDLNNLAIHSDYSGNDSVIMGDGSNHMGILGPRPE